MPEPLTARQRQMFDFVKHFHEEKNLPPTIREIQHHFHLKSTKGVKVHLDILMRKGYINKTNKARDIDIVGMPRMKSVPMIGKVAAGKPLLAEENIEGYFGLDRDLARWDDSFLLKVQGQSMLLAGIFDGDYVLVRPQKTAEEKEIVVARINDEATIKRFGREGNLIKLIPENPEFETLVVKEDQPNFELVGKVMAVLRVINGEFASRKAGSSS